MRYLLSICIPNYNRLERLTILTEEILSQIRENGFYEEVELCISDDGSEEDPGGYIENLKGRYGEAGIVYERHIPNKGMDYNFLRSVQIAHGEFCWIIGNDDCVCKGGVKRAVHIVREAIQQNILLIVTPFDSYSYEEKLLKTYYPLGEGQQAELFDTAVKQRKGELLDKVRDSTALFGFLSNVLFRREDWMRHGDMFRDKMNTIFIQVYMNLQTLMEGAKYWYVNEKVVINHTDEHPADVTKLSYKVTKGLYEAMAYFFKGEECRKLQETIAGPFVNRLFWSERKEKPYLEDIFSLDLKAIHFFNQYLEGDLNAFSGKKVFLFGAGKKGDGDYRVLNRHGADVLAFIDNNAGKCGGEKHGKKIISLEEVRNQVFDYMIISIYRYETDVFQQLLEFGIDTEKIKLIP